MPELPRAAPDIAALPVPALDAEVEISALAARYIRAESGLIQLFTRAGGSLEDLAARLPPGTRSRIDAAAILALRTAYSAAQGSHGRRPGGDMAHRAAVTAFGAIGGIGGLPTALAEFPITTTAILRSLQEIAARHGEDPAAEQTRLACLQVFGAGGPLAEDDGADFAFLGARLTLTGAALNGLIAQIAPRFAAALARKLAAKAIPALGATAGAAVNLAYARHYQEMAHIHFGLRRLARLGNLHAPAAFRAEVGALRAIRRA